MKKICQLILILSLSLFLTACPRYWGGPSLYVPAPRLYAPRVYAPRVYAPAVPVPHLYAPVPAPRFYAPSIPGPRFPF